MQQLDVGEPIPIRTQWWDDDGAAVEPNAIAVTITTPTGATITRSKAQMAGSSSLTPASTLDVWSFDVVADAEGLWLIHAVATIGVEQSVQDSSVIVGENGAPGQVPCQPWCTWDEVEACGSVTPEPTNEIAKELWIDQASEIMFNLTARRYPGVCVVTRSLCYACAHCRPLVCSCDPYPGIDLGGRYPVWGVYSVIVDGTPLDATSYAIRGRRWLVRTDGQVWPSGWNAIDPNAWRVQYAVGELPTTAARLAAARLALEIAKRCSGDASCKLPQRVTNVVREGVTFTVLDSMKMIAEGRTGLDLVDLWIASDNIGNKPQPGIYHPAMHSGRRY